MFVKTRQNFSREKFKRVNPAVISVLFGFLRFCLQENRGERCLKKA
jgi:hypothetical protein